LQNIFLKRKVYNADISDSEVAIYFGANTSTIYQFEQWISVFNHLEKNKKIVIITRDISTYTWVTKHTNYSVVYCRQLEDLMETYENSAIKCILYVNHGVRNFQSLTYRSALHVHINHGESEKTSTMSNQINAYNYAFIVGEAALNKYKYNLLKYDSNHFIQVGRPQLEHIQNIKMNLPKNKKIILYAPTWEGTHSSMNFTSLDEYGMQIVQLIIKNPNYYLIYKPHPNTGSRQPSTKYIHKKIIKLLHTYHNGKVILSGDINAIYEHIDLAIFDNSAVAIDYLQVDKPMIMTDMFHRIKDRQSKPTITKAARMLSLTDTYSIPMIVKEEIEKDTLREMRNKIKHYFLGDFDYNKQESTEKFVSTILDIVEERDTLVDNLVTLNEEADEIK